MQINAFIVSRVRTLWKAGGGSLIDWEESTKCGFAEIPWVVEPPVLVQPADGLHFIVGQLEIEYRQILNKAIRSRSFRHDRCPALNPPAQHDLRRRSGVVRSETAHNVCFQHRFARL